MSLGHFDHLVVIAATLAAGLDHVERQIGLRVPPGGAHPLMGTHNHLIRLGDAGFLEVIAPDPDAAPPIRPRWFGLDHPPATPRLAHWVLRVADMAAVHPTLPEACGAAIAVTRGDLRWLLSVAEDGRLPMGGVFPSVIEWQADPLPPIRMPGAGLDLVRLELSHPDPVELGQGLAGLIDDARISVHPGPEAGLAALISTPEGPKWLR